MSQTISTLKVAVVADTSGVTDGLELTKKEIREANRVIDSLRSPSQVLADKEAKLNRLASGAGGLNQSQLAAALAKERDEFAKSASVMGQFESALSPVNIATAAAAAGVASLTAAAYGLGNAVANRISEIDALGDAAAKLGMSASSLSEIRGAAFLGDVDAGTVDAMLQKMLVAVGKEKEVFGELNLDVAKLKQQSPAAMFEEIATAISAIPDKAGQMAAIADVFGKSGPEGAALVERFRELSQTMRESGAGVSDDLAARVGGADDAFKRISLSAEAFKNTLAGLSAAPLTAVIDAANSAASNHWLGSLATGGSIGAVTMNPVAGFMAGKAVFDEAAKNRRDAEADRAKDSNDAVDAALQHEIEATKVTADEVAKIRSQNFRKLIEDDAAFERDLQQARVRDAIRAIDEEERARKKANADAWDARMKEVDDGQKLIDSLKTPQEQTKDRLLADLDALRKSGLDNPETRDRLMRRAAGELARAETGGFGAPGADKGTRAAREAIIGSQQQEEQTSLMRRMVAELEKLVAKDELEVTEISGP